MQPSPQTNACCVYEHARHLPSVSYKRYQTGRAARATKHLFPTLPLHVSAAVFKEASEDGDTGRAAFGSIVRVNLLIKRVCQLWLVSLFSMWLCHLPTFVHKFLAKQ